MQSGNGIARQARRCRVVQHAIVGRPWPRAHDGQRISGGTACQQADDSVAIGWQFLRRSLYRMLFKCCGGSVVFDFLCCFARTASLYLHALRCPSLNIRINRDPAPMDRAVRRLGQTLFLALSIRY